MTHSGPSKHEEADPATQRMSVHARVSTSMLAISNSQAMSATARRRSARCCAATAASCSRRRRARFAASLESTAGDRCDRFVSVALDRQYGIKGNILYIVQLRNYTFAQDISCCHGQAQAQDQAPMDCLTPSWHAQVTARHLSVCNMGLLHADSNHLKCRLENVPSQQQSHIPPTCRTALTPSY